MIISKEEHFTLIKHIITVPSEKKFIEKLSKFISDGKSFFDEDFDWWIFSKLNEHLDEVYIPYYDPEHGRIRKFIPDFIFWFKKNKNYDIVFVDPKGTAHINYVNKILGYKVLFEENNMVRVFNFNGLNVRIYLLLYTSDKNKVRAYSEYWIDSISDIKKVLVRNGE
ncbi:MAG: hypothetical protein K9W45_11305 [Candidatus Heimdallarchaeum aukensis]|nr:MAG: hypothetical protein K9W45_11305 [Candidatus Heimdallarchaeum aukensis]